MLVLCKNLAPREFRPQVLLASLLASDSQPFSSGCLPTILPVFPLALVHEAHAAAESLSLSLHDLLAAIPLDWREQSSGMSRKSA